MRRSVHSTDRCQIEIPLNYRFGLEVVARHLTSTWGRPPFSTLLRAHGRAYTHALIRALPQCVEAGTVEVRHLWDGPHSWAEWRMTHGAQESRRS